MQNPISNMSPTLQGLLLTLFSTLMFSCMHGLVRVLVDELHPFEVAFFRNLFGLVAVLPLLVRTGAIRLKSKQPGLQLLRSVVGVAAMSSWFYGLSVVPIATATALSFISGIFASLAAIMLLGEKMRLRRSIAVGMGFIGVLIILRPGMAGFDLHMLVVLFCRFDVGARCRRGQATYPHRFYGCYCWLDVHHYDFDFQCSGVYGLGVADLESVFGIGSIGIPGNHWPHLFYQRAKTY